MKNYYLFFFLLASLTSKGQTNYDEANYYLGSAYSHVKDAYDSNNISHLKYYANRSVESFELSKKPLKSCDCDTAFKLAEKAIELLTKVEDAETFEDGRFYVKRGRDVTKESMIEIDKCSAGVYNANAVSAETSEISEIQNEQHKLKQQQEALRLKEQELKTQLAEQKEKELTLKKKELILSYENVVTANVKTYNETLKVCDCNHEPLKLNESSEDLSSESIENIKSYFSNSLKSLASNYLSQLEVCAN
ncbi:MAG: hypothetical protein WA839_01680 [Flavobacteriaceae bacterium]